MTVHVSRRYGFYASHRLHAPSLSDEENRALYGKCNNPHGHGHNYEVEVTVSGQVDPVTGRAVDLFQLDALCQQVIVSRLNYQNLNEFFSDPLDEIFGDAFNPTTELLTMVIYRNLRSNWQYAMGARGPKLEKIRIWETERNICEVEGRN